MVGGLELGNFPAPNVPAKLSWLGEVTRDRSIERVQSERREYPGSPFFLLCVFAPLRESLPWPGQPKPILAPASLKAQRRQGERCQPGIGWCNASTVWSDLRPLAARTLASLRLCASPCLGLASPNQFSRPLRSRRKDAKVRLNRPVPWNRPSIVRSEISNPHLKSSAAWCARFAQDACPNLPME